MTRKEQVAYAGKLGAQAVKQKAVDSYYKEPSICKSCGEIIQIKDGQKPSDARQKKFCSRSCAATYNNRGTNRWKSKPSLARTKTKQGFCESCGVEIEFSPTSDGRYYKRKFCEDCLKKQNSKNGKQSAKKRIRDKEQNDWSCINEMTKRQVLDKCGNTWTMKSTITRYARKTYRDANKPQWCKVCGYDKHIHVSHKSDVKDFPMDTKIGEINNLDNLVGLCPNHHWEFDNGLLDL